MQSPIRTLLLLAALPGLAAAQDSLPPWEGGFTASLGQPRRHQWYAGGSIGRDWRLEGAASPVILGSLGISRPIGPPRSTLTAALEAFGGMRSGRSEAGVRALLGIPAFRVSGGAEYAVRGNQIHPIVALTLPIRRGGIFGGGTQIRLEAALGRGNALRGTLLVPLFQPMAGRGRPRDDQTRLPVHRTSPVPRPSIPVALDSTLDQLRAAALRIQDLVVPPIDVGTQEPVAGMVPVIRRLRRPVPFPELAAIPDLAVDRTIEIYHSVMERAFSIAEHGGSLPAGGSSEAGRALAARARTVMLDHVLYPWNRLLGRKKADGLFTALVTQARGNFARALVADTRLRAVSEPAILWVFQEWLGTVDSIRRRAGRDWRDNRLVWLPLQLALRPDQHDTQEELDAIVEAAVGQRFTDGNRIWYVVNEEFRAEVTRTIREARSYHVLWIHDFRGRNDEGQPDKLALRYVVDAYLGALTDAVRAYDGRGKLPTYMIFLDQYYYDLNRGRLWLDLMERPLGKVPRLPRGFEAFERQLREAQDSLRLAVEGSRLLQAEARQYGRDWLENLIKVHVSITNRTDPSFRTPGILPVAGIPDDIMRDHRKIAFYDVTEDDPYRGRAIYTGMGIGEHYEGPTWEDRSIVAEGPMLLALKEQARALLLSQGMQPEQIPYLLRPRPVPASYQEKIEARIGAATDPDPSQRGMELHNGTGFQDKPINVAKAVLYSLMPPGSVIKTPDSLWGSDLFASLLAGSAFRGVRVLFIAPSLLSAPSSGWPAMGLAHDLFARLIVLQQEFGSELEAAGGMLKTGIYNPGLGTHDAMSRFGAAYINARRTPFLRRLYPVYHMVDSLLKGVASAESAIDTISPKLHLKASFLASREAWDSLVSGPEMEQVLQAYFEQIQRTERSAMQAAEGMNEAGRILINAFESRLSDAERSRVVYYLMVGSANQDYRSMFMDGEASVLLSGWSTVVSLLDFGLLANLSVWVDDLKLLDELLPPPSMVQRTIARWIRQAL
jgi:hypothetical protein